MSNPHARSGAPGSQRSALRLLQDLLDALLAGGVAVQAGLLLLAPLLHLRLHVHARLLALLVPIRESLLRLVLGLKHAQEVLQAEGVDGLGLVELVRGAPAVLPSALDVRWDLAELREHLLV